MSCPTCSICQSQEVAKFQDAGDPYTAYKCQKCTFIFIYPQPKMNDLVNHYHEEAYYKDWIAHQMPARHKMWRKRLKDLKKYISSGRLLDVGCGIGTFLKLAKNAGFEVQGTEVSRFACKYVQDECGIDVYQGFLEDARFENESFDVVTIWHVLEHVPRPQEILKEIHRILKPGGLIIVAVPNVENYVMQFAYRIGRGRELKLFDIEDKELHLSHFSPKTIQKILNQAGFNPLHVDLDLAQVQSSKQWVDRLAGFCHFFTRQNWGIALKAYARKEG